MNLNDVSDKTKQDLSCRKQTKKETIISGSKKEEAIF